jgi:hypothetical protein
VLAFFDALMRMRMDVSVGGRDVEQVEEEEERRKAGVQERLRLD